VLKRISFTELLEELISNKISMPQKTTYLERNSLTDVTQRFTNVNYNIAELYHENSKLSKYTIEEMVVKKLDDVKSFKERTVLTPYKVALPNFNFKKESSKEHNRLFAIAKLAEVLHELMKTPDLLYSLDLKIVLNTGDLLWFNPAQNELYIERSLSTLEMSNLQECIFDVSSIPIKSYQVGICIVGLFLRNMVLYGIRGYRKTLIEAGQVAQFISQKLEMVNLQTDIITEFHDRDMDLLLGCDGIERSILLTLWINNKEA
jgi:hypothetical protein